MSHGLYGIDYQQAARDFPPGIIPTVPRMDATPENAEDWYAMVPRILDRIAAAVSANGFLTGSRPHLADFAFYGMLNQIHREPTGYTWVSGGPEAVREWLGRLEETFKAGGSSEGEPAADAQALADGFELEAPPVKYNRKMLGNDLDLLESLYASGGRLPEVVETTVFDELRPLAAGGSPLVAERTALATALGE